MTDQELDARIALEVMGWSDGPHTLYAWSDRKARKFPLHNCFHVIPKVGDREYTLGDYSAYNNERGEKLFCGEPKQVHWAKHWSTDIGVAMGEVVERVYEIYEGKVWIKINIIPKLFDGFKKYECVISNHSLSLEDESTLGYGNCDFLPEAVCLAALEAVKVKV